jgi:hypothetical protein
MRSGREDSGFWRPVHAESFLQCGSFHSPAYSQKAGQDQQKGVRGPTAAMRAVSVSCGLSARESRVDRLNPQRARLRRIQQNGSTRLTIPGVSGNPPRRRIDRATRATPSSVSGASSSLASLPRATVFAAFAGAHAGTTVLAMLTALAMAPVPTAILAVLAAVPTTISTVATFTIAS